MTPNLNNKKNGGLASSDSVFSSITPQPAASRPAATPAATPEQVAALKTRLDSLERNLAALEAKKTAAPAVIPEQEAALGARLDSLEKQIAAQTGELKKYGMAVKTVAAEFLTSLNERQKSSALDQRMHDQLEKSWARMRDLEEKLGVACKTLIEAQLKAEEERKGGAETLAEFGRKAAALEERFSELRTYIGVARDKDDTALDESFARFQRRADDLEKKMSGFGNSIVLLRLRVEEAVKQVSGVGSKVDTMAEILGRLDPEKYEVHLSELRGELTGIRHAFKEQADHFREKFLDFNLITDNFKLEAKALGLGLEKVVNGNERLLATAFDNIGIIINKALERFMAELQEKNRGQFAQLSINYDSALDIMRQSGSVCSSIEYVSKRLGSYESTLENFLAQIGGERLSYITGISGIVMREHFGAISVMSAELKREKEYLEAARKEISDKTGRGIKGNTDDAA